MSRLCKIVPERCIACGLCALYAPEIFDYDDNGIVLFAQEPEANQQFIPAKDQGAVIEAYKQCPVRAILLEK
ncbi:ferredoxin [Tetragenococcus koreensis]|uniref:ferredoxin n=1 Tax=Tetragenococcus koreensis TaxID=290335 RepID=UPI000F507277|nr:ferredoxin [Tetragenococcus koreensis]AYW44644.1 ferredoxin [Tetragenococcus koreensis]MDN6243007.1 ferredoxin [Tetragenococcus koreensis]MDN6250204.1 ferredoxin [Tetragenococcus koreensis]MDN6253900.1 ferredoxin [Tetragenococcus koreensis]MDN6345716.1 ferredoxin [Tetragenococcus koreensis]